MSFLCNLTGYGAATLPSMRRDGRDLALAITAARFKLPRPGESPDIPLVPHFEQPGPALGDIYSGRPEFSSLSSEGQTAYFRPATDITVSGSAHAPGDAAVATLKVRVSVGSCSCEALVFGDRVWDVGLTGLPTISSPRPFVRMPLVWERAFGGSVYDEDGHLSANEPRNPVGRGFFQRSRQVTAQLLPNIEDARNLIERPSDRPSPVNFAPVARWWQPRASYAGTYDASWLRERAPVWADDFDERFFCAAPAPLQASPHLRGGEAVYLEGLDPEGPMRFRLPAPRMVVRFRFNGHDVRRAMLLDAVIIEPDAGLLTLIHRASAPAIPCMSAHRETVIRHIERWEDLVT